MCNIYVRDLVDKVSSSLKIGDLLSEGKYPVYGAQGLVGYLNSFQTSVESIALIKDGAGVGRVQIIPAFSSVIGTMQLLVPKKDIDVNYLYYLFTYLDLGQNFSGATIPHIYFRDYGELAIKKHSPTEQKEIGKKLSDIDRLVQLSEKKKTLIDELLKSRFYEIFGDVGNNSKNFEVVPLSEIADYWNGLTYKPDDVVKQDGTLVLRSSNIQDGILCFEDNVFVNCSIKEKCMVKENDILMCSRNGSAKLVGKVALIENIDKPMAFGAFMMIIRSNYYSYLKNYFETDAFRDQIATNTSTINQITAGMMDNVKVPMPTKECLDEFEKVYSFAKDIKQVALDEISVATELLNSKIDYYFGI